MKSAMHRLMISLETLCQHVGEAQLRALVAAFYRRVKTDELIGSMYPPEDWEGSEKRLADFLVYRFGGPQTYLEERGHPRLRGRHMPFSIGLAERDQWLTLMGESVLEIGITQEAAEVMIPFFAQVADMMRNRAE